MDYTNSTVYMRELILMIANVSPIIEVLEQEEMLRWSPCHRDHVLLSSAWLRAGKHRGESWIARWPVP